MEQFGSMCFICSRGRSTSKLTAWKVIIGCPRMLDVLQKQRIRRPCQKGRLSGVWSVSYAKSHFNFHPEILNDTCKNSTLQPPNLSIEDTERRSIELKPSMRCWRKVRVGSVAMLVVAFRANCGEGVPRNQHGA